MLTPYNSKMLESTTHLGEAKSWAQVALGAKNVAKYYLAADKFVAAYRSENSFSFLLTSKPFYGHLYGPDAFLDSRLSEVAVADDALPSLPGFIKDEKFQIWEAITSSGESSLELLHDADEINSMIDEHAPGSSVRPGEKEVVFWAGLRSSEGVLMACAVVVQWSSGFHVLSSVMTRTEYRRKGLATQLCSEILAEAHSRGIATLGLGVRADNFAAQRAYTKAGFRRLAEFTNYSRE